MQGKAERVKAAGMLELLLAFYRDKVAMRHRHAAAAQQVSHYDFNNTYQYIIAREDMHLRWLIDAITDLGGTLEEGLPPASTPPGKDKDPQHAVIAADRDDAKRFVDSWRPKIAGLPNARHVVMLNVILGEVAEQQRFFELALAGRDDLLGRRADGAGTGGGVLPTRWVGGERT
jgi:hypothetical protein